MPTLVGHGESTQFTSPATINLASIACQPGDLLLIWQENGNATQDYPTAPVVSNGTAGPWRSFNTTDNTSQAARCKVWYAKVLTVTGGGGTTVSALVTGTTGGAWGCGYVVERAHGWLGNTALIATTADQTGALITVDGVRPGSDLLYFGSDWDANAGVATWRAIDGFTPTIGNGGVLYENGDSTNYAARIARWPGTSTTAGSKGLGYTTLTVRPAGIAVEIPAAPTANPDAVYVRPPTANGLQPASGVAAWAAGAYAELLPDGWPFDIAIASVEFEQPAAPAITTAYEALIEVATGAPGSETVIAQIPWTFRNVTAVGYFRQDPATLVTLPEPILVTAGTRVAVRVSDSHTASLTYTGTKLEFREVAAAGGAALTANIDDTLTVADSTRADVVKAIADTAAVADVTAADVAKAIADTLAVADAATPSSGLAGVIPDSITVADSATAQAGKAAQIDDTATVADAQTLETGYGRTIPDTLTVADATTADVVKAIADAIGVADATTSSVATAIVDSIAVADQATAQAGKAAQIDDTAAVADNVATAGGKGANVDDSIAVADATILNVAKAIADVLGVADATSMAAAIAIADPLGVADNITAGLAYALGLADTAGVADALGTATGKAAQIDDSIGVADALTVAMTKALADAVTVADAAALAVATIIADAIAVNDARGLAVAKTIADAIAVADTATPAPGRSANLADTLTVADLVDLEHVLSAYRPRRPGHWTGALAGAARRLAGHRAGSPGSANPKPGHSDDDSGDVELLP